MKLILYVADEFKKLEGGKTLAVGLFTDRVVVLNVPQETPPPSHEMPYGVPLGLLACLMDLPTAELTGSMTVVPPSGQVVVSIPSFKANGLIGGSTNVSFRLDPFLMTDEGIYTVVLSFEGLEELSEKFELRIKRIDGTAAPTLFVRQIGKPLGESAQ
ncbi:MAG: hypothetical protein Q8K45_12265 [Rubrivivax sp.]|nr:hypothetical protein [Rubrivivax sp.]